MLVQQGFQTLLHHFQETGSHHQNYGKKWFNSILPLFTTEGGQLLLRRRVEEVKKARRGQAEVQQVGEVRLPELRGQLAGEQEARAVQDPGRRGVRDRALEGLGRARHEDARRRRVWPRHADGRRRHGSCAH